MENENVKAHSQTVGGVSVSEAVQVAPREIEVEWKAILTRSLTRS